MANMHTAAEKPPASNEILFRSGREEENRLVATYNNKLTRYKAGKREPKRLPAEEERELLRRWHQDGDQAARQTLALRTDWLVWELSKFKRSHRAAARINDKVQRAARINDTIQRNELASISAFSDTLHNKLDTPSDGDDTADRTLEAIGTFDLTEFNVSGDDVPNRAPMLSGDARRLSDEDIIAAGREGLLEAIDNFDLAQPWRWPNPRGEEGVA